MRTFHPPHHHHLPISQAMGPVVITRGCRKESEAQAGCGWTMIDTTGNARTDST
jgi:hypothetical protein